MSHYVDRYAAVFREAADRQARNASATRLHRLASIVLRPVSNVRAAGSRPSFPEVPVAPALAFVVVAMMALGAVVVTTRTEDRQVEVPAARPTATGQPAPIASDEVDAHAVELPPRIAGLVTRSDPQKTHDALLNAGYSVRYITIGVTDVDPNARLTKPLPNTQILSVLGRGGGALKDDDVEQLLIELVPRR